MTKEELTEWITREIQNNDGAVIHQNEVWEALAREIASAHEPQDASRERALEDFAKANGWGWFIGPERLESLIKFYPIGQLARSNEESR